MFSSRPRRPDFSAYIRRSATRSASDGVPASSGSATEPADELIEKPSPTSLSAPRARDTSDSASSGAIAAIRGSDGVYTQVDAAGVRFATGRQAPNGVPVVELSLSAAGRGALAVLRARSNSGLVAVESRGRSPNR